MRMRMVSMAVALGMGVSGWTALSLIQGQEARTPPPGGISQATYKAAPPASSPPLAPTRDLRKLSPLQQQMYLSVQRGAD